MMDDRKMRLKIDTELAGFAKRKARGAARLAAAVGASGKLLAGCIVTEYGAPLYGVEVDGGPADATGDEMGVLYAGPMDAAEIDLGMVTDYGVLDAGDIDVGENTLYGFPADAAPDEDAS